MPSKHLEPAREFLADKDRDPAELRAAMDVGDRAYARLLLALLGDEDKRVRNRAAKLVAHLGEARPKSLQPHWDRLVEWAAGPETIPRWNALVALGHLAPLATDAQLRTLVPVVVALLADESMVTAGHAIACLGRIAAAGGAGRAAALGPLLKIEQGSRDPECALILDGKRLIALEPLVPVAGPAERKRIQGLAERHRDCRRAGTRKLAGRLLKQLAPVAG